MKRWNIYQGTDNRGTFFRVKGSTTKYYSVPQYEELSHPLRVITQDSGARHPAEWPCRQTGAAQLELAADNAEDRLARLRQTYEDAMNH